MISLKGKRLTKGCFTLSRCQNTNVVGVTAIVLICFWQIFMRSPRYFSGTSQHQPPSIVDKYHRNLMNPHKNGNKTNLIIISSTGRSGSSVTAEILAATSGSVLFFEPDYHLLGTECIKNEKCLQDYTKAIFTCTFDKDFELYFLKRKQFNRLFNKEVRECYLRYGLERRKCLDKRSLRKACDKSQFKIVKLIRVRLKYLVDLTEDQEVQAKIIFLARDPRGSALSNKLHHPTVVYMNACKLILEDMKAFHAQHYNKNSFLLVVYERLCFNPLKEFSKIFNFLGYREIPEEVSASISKHMFVHKETKDPYNTQRIAQLQYDKWRWQIDKKLLRDLEELAECQTALSLLKFRLFNNTETLLNKNVSVFLE